MRRFLWIEGKSLSVENIALDTNTDEEIIVFIGQIEEAKHPLCNIKEQNRGRLFRSFPSGVYRYAHRMRSAAQQANRSPVDTSAWSVLEFVGLLISLRYGHVLEEMYGYHGRSRALQRSGKSDQVWEQQGEGL